MPHGPTGKESILRVAVVQLEVHPFVRVENQDFSSEPFVMEPSKEDGQMPLLAGLAAQGINVANLQRHCSSRYQQWHTRRIWGVLRRFVGAPASFEEHERTEKGGSIESTSTKFWMDWSEAVLSRPTPQREAGKNVAQAHWGHAAPHIVVLPEFAHSRRMLPMLCAFARAYKVVIFAGTHAFEATPEALEDYQQLFSTFWKADPTHQDAVTTDPKQKADDFFKSFAEVPLPTKTVAVVIDSNGSPRLWGKRALSPFEKSDFFCQETEKAAMTALQNLPDWNDLVMVHPFGVGAGPPLQTRYLICSEGLQEPLIKHDAADEKQLLIISAYDTDPERFRIISDHYARSLIPAIICNDGHYGGSRVTLVADKRGNGWWYGPPRLTRLPRGDCAMICAFHPGKGPVMGAWVTGRTYSLERLCSIVPDNSMEPETRVAFQLTNLANNRASWIKEPLAQPKDRRRSVADELSDILTQENPSALQEIKLKFLLSLARNGNDMLEHWGCLGTDCVLSVPRDHDDVPVDFGDPFCSLQELEQSLARHCLERISVIEAEGAMDIEGVNALARARTALRKFTKSRSLDPRDAIKTLFGQLNDEARRTARQRLHQSLGMIVERFRATAGWIFLIEPKLMPTNEPFDTSQHPPGNAWQDTTTHCLVGRIAHNSPTIQPGPFEFKIGRGVVGWVAAQGPECRGWIANDVSLLPKENARAAPELGRPVPRYRNSVPSTKSEIAVPIVAYELEVAGRKNTTNKPVVIGVLNLESNEKNAFLAPHLAELRAAATQLAADALLLREYYRTDRVVGWHPDAHGWSVRTLLDRFCHAVATSVVPNGNREALSCTIWRLDAPKENMFVLGTARFDYEYATSRFLDAYDSWTGEVARKLERGRVSRKEPESDLAYRQNPVSTSQQQTDAFTRPMKAVRMEVVDALSVPVFASIDQGMRLPSEVLQEEKWRGSADGIRLGAMNLYFFRREKSQHGDRLVQQFEGSVAPEFADHVGRLISNFRTLRRAVLAAKLRASLIEDSIPEVNTLETFKRFMLRVFEAEGCSLFLRIPGQTALFCAATSGLAHSKDIVPDELYVPKVAYRFDDSAPKDTGFTVWLARNPGATYRRHDVANIEEFDNVTKASNHDQEHRTQTQEQPLQPQNRYPEDYEPTDSDHRRFLGGSFVVPGTDPGELLGVIRLVRKPHSPPFTESDEDLLKWLLAVAAPFLLDERAAWCPGEPHLSSLKSIADCAARIIQNPPGGDAIPPSPADHKRAQLVRRIIRRNTLLHHWNHRSVDALLQDALALLSPFKATLASIRLLQVNVSNVHEALTKSEFSDLSKWSLRVYAFHSVKSVLPLMEMQDGSVNQPTIGRLVLQNWRRAGLQRIEGPAVGELASFTAGEKQQPFSFSLMPPEEVDPACPPLSNSLFYSLDHHSDRVRSGLVYPFPYTCSNQTESTATGEGELRIKEPLPEQYAVLSIDSEQPHDEGMMKAFLCVAKLVTDKLRFLGEVVDEFHHVEPKLQTPPMILASASPTPKPLIRATDGIWVWSMPESP